ncbi:hypothetical protein ACRRTK_016864 [Alexandromys fortis]
MLKCTEMGSSFSIVFFKTSFSFSLGDHPGLLPQFLWPSFSVQASLLARMCVTIGRVLGLSPSWKHAFPVAVRETQTFKP